MAHLHRAIVTLPDWMWSRDCGSIERVVFFETESLRADPVAHLQQLLARVWLTDCTDWCIDGLIYNVSPERELGYSDSAYDTRLFELGWSHGPVYATAEKVEIYCTPSTALRLKKALAALPAPAALQTA